MTEGLAADIGDMKRWRESEEEVTVSYGREPMFAGQSIHGTVIKTGGDAVRLHLKIDKKQDASIAYPYPWVPDTGSVMYCMPEKGTKVSLYFPDEDERNAIAVNCIRQNGATCSGMSDPSKRALTTAGGKRMYLEPKKMGFDIESTGHSMSLEDSKGISFKSGTTVNISAVGGIEFYAKKILNGFISIFLRYF